MMSGDGNDTETEWSEDEKTDPSIDLDVDEKTDPQLDSGVAAQSLSHSDNSTGDTVEPTKVSAPTGTRGLVAVVVLVAAAMVFFWPQPGAEELKVANKMAAAQNVQGAVVAYEQIIMKWPDSRSATKAIDARRTVLFDALQQIDKTEKDRLKVADWYAGFAKGNPDTKEAEASEVRAKEIRAEVKKQEEEAAEARAKLAAERSACSNARELDTKAAWKTLLDEQPNITCSKEGNNRLAMRDATAAERASIKRYSNICLGIKRRCTQMGKQYMYLMESGRWAEAKRMMNRLTNVEASKSFQPRMKGDDIISRLKEDGVYTKKIEKEHADACAVLGDL